MLIACRPAANSVNNSTLNVLVFHENSVVNSMASDLDVTSCDIWLGNAQLKEQVQSGQRRIAELLHKATAVDKEEYDRVVQESDAFRNKLSTEQALVKELTSANTAAQSSLASIQAEVTQLTAAAKADQDNLRSTQAEVSRLQLVADQAESLQATVASLEVPIMFNFSVLSQAAYSSLCLCLTLNEHAS